MIDWGGASHHVALDTPLDRMSQRFLAAKLMSQHFFVDKVLVKSCSRVKSGAGESAKGGETIQLAQR